MSQIITPEHKIFTDLSQAAEWRETLHKTGRKLALTNGCFDILHRGHAEYLLAARNLGDAIIVLLNSDAPKSDRAQAVTRDIASRYGVNCMAVNCLELSEAAVAEVLKAVLYEFPMQELDIFLPSWVDALPGDHPLKD